ncbi:MAG: hypothetical protein ACLRX4_08155 [Oscillospiraceae bacterium]
MREDLALRLERFKEQWSVDAAAQGRVARPMVKFIGEEVLDTAVAALLQGRISCSQAERRRARTFLRTTLHGSSRARCSPPRSM